MMVNRAPTWISPETKRRLRGAPEVRLLRRALPALNPPKVSELAGADYNVKLNGLEIWLPIIATALRGPQESGPSSIL